MENINKLEIYYQLSWSSHSSQIAPFHYINTHQQQTLGYVPVSIKRNWGMESSKWAFQIQNHVSVLPPQMPFSPPNLCQLGVVICSLQFFHSSPFFSVFKNYSLGLICQTFLFASYVTEMIKWISCPPLACWGTYHKCFLSMLPNFQQCVKCILVTTKDAYGHWDICQIEYRAKKVPYFALEQVRTYWEEGKK